MAQRSYSILNHTNNQGEGLLERNRLAADLIPILFSLDAHFESNLYIRQFF